MDDFIDDIEAGVVYSPGRYPTKKMKKRKQLDALLKFRSKNSSNPTIRSSEDELFLSHNKSQQSKRSLHDRRCYNYIRHILSFCLVCIFMIVCVGLAYANIELKSEVQNLSLRVNEIENRFSNSEIKRVISAIDQLKTRINLIERFNISYVYERVQQLQSDLHQIRKRPSVVETSMTSDDTDVASKLGEIEQKSAEFSQVANEFDKLNRDTNLQVTDVINEKWKSLSKDLIERLLEQEQNTSIYQKTSQLTQNVMLLNETLTANTLKWNDELKSFRNQFETFKTVDMKVHFDQLIELLRNSSEKTSAVVTSMQTDLDKIHTQIDACKCSKESIHLKPSIVQTDQLQQSLATKPNAADSPPISPQSSEKNATIDIAQVFNRQPSSISPA